MNNTVTYYLLRNKIIAAKFFTFLENLSWTHHVDNNRFQYSLCLSQIRFPDFKGERVHFSIHIYHIFLVFHPFSQDYEIATSLQNKSFNKIVRLAFHNFCLYRSVLLQYFYYFFYDLFYLKCQSLILFFII